MDAVQHHRETVQPIREKTGGSTFKNPEGTSAWKEIDKAGCRGLMIGGAQMSPMHCNFMINTGNATGYDLEYLGETVRARVLEHSGIRLQWEIKRLGRFKPGHEVAAVSRPAALTALITQCASCHAADSTTPVGCKMISSLNIRSLIRLATESSL